MAIDQVRQEGIRTSLSANQPSRLNSLISQQTGMLSSLLKPRQDEARRELEARLYKQGRLGGASGVKEQEALEGALARQNMEVALQGMQLGREERDAEFGRGFQLLGLGEQSRQAELGREFQSSEAEAQRGFIAGESALDRLFRGEQAGLDRDLQQGLQANDLASRANLLREQLGFQGKQAQLDRNFERELVERRIQLQQEEARRQRQKNKAGGILGIIGGVAGGVFSGGNPMGAAAGAQIGTGLADLFS